MWSYEKAIEKGEKGLSRVTSGRVFREIQGHAKGVMMGNVREEKKGNESGEQNRRELKEENIRKLMERIYGKLEKKKNRREMKRRD